jgi:hypothetical protein
MGVFDVEEAGDAVVADGDKCTTCRLCIEDEVVGDAVDIAKDRGVFMFTVEGTGMIEPEDAVWRALEVLRGKGKVAGIAMAGGVPTVAI